MQASRAAYCMQFALWCILYVSCVWHTTFSNIWMEKLVSYGFYGTQVYRHKKTPDWSLEIKECVYAHLALAMPSCVSRDSMQCFFYWMHIDFYWLQYSTFFVSFEVKRRYQKLQQRRSQNKNLDNKKEDGNLSMTRLYSAAYQLKLDGVPSTTTIQHNINSNKLEVIQS